MKFIKMYGLICSGILLISGPAQGREFADIYTDCGLGAMMAPSNDAVAAVTNVTWDLGTTAISSNSSSEDTCNGGKVAAASFINNSYASLEKDLAKGEGEHITALFEIMDCSSDSHSQLVDAVRGNFAEYAGSTGYSTASSYQKSENLYNIVTETVNNGFTGDCNIT